MALQVATAAINALRDNHYVLNSVSGLNERSVLMEGSRTNSFTFSADDTNGAWLKGNISVTGSAATGPDGVASSASRWVEDATLNLHFLNRAFTGATDAGTTSVSRYFKAGERTFVRITTKDKAAATASSWFNLTTGAWGTTAGTHTVRATALGNGWYLLTCSVPNGTGVGTMECQWHLATADNTGAYTGDGVSGLYSVGGQGEIDAPFSSSYIPTAAATVTRGADSYSVPFTTPPQAMTLYQKLKDLGSSATLNARTIQVGGSNANSLRIIGSGVQGSYSLIHDDGSANVQSNVVGGGSFGDTHELLAQWYPDGSVQLSLSVNGAAATVASRSASKAIPATFGLSLLAFGCSTTGAGQGFAAFLVPYKVALGVKTLAQMQAL